MLDQLAALIASPDILSALVGIVAYLATAGFGWVVKKLHALVAATETKTDDALLEAVETAVRKVLAEKNA